jgi:hypothetical protein
MTQSESPVPGRACHSLTMAMFYEAALGIRVPGVFIRMA